MNNSEFEKSTSFRLSEINEYLHNGIAVKPILERPTGNVNIIFMDIGQQLFEKSSRFDQFIQVIKGIADCNIDDSSFTLNSGEFIIIPAHSNNTIYAKEKLKLISTIIKSGYET